MLPRHAVWQILDVRAIWVKELAAALGGRVPLVGWLPQIDSIGFLKDREWSDRIDDPPLDLRHFPLQRGFARAPVRGLAGEGRRLARRLRARAPEPAASPLVCCSPHYADAAWSWPGPVVYYASDLFAAGGENPNRVRRLETAIVDRADLVACVSTRIAASLQKGAACSPAKIVISPNAGRAEDVPAGPLLRPDALPDDVADLPRPVAGVIGNLAANMDWRFLTAAIDATPWLSWLFVGPTEMPADGAAEEAARAALITRGGRVRFTGYRPYASLAAYARGLDVAVLPYRRREPTYSGSSVRFFQHLAACRPMLASRGFAELLGRTRYLRLVDSAEEAASALEELRRAGFADGLEVDRWRACRRETWDARASALVAALDMRLSLQ